MLAAAMGVACTALVMATAMAIHNITHIPAMATATQVTGMGAEAMEAILATAIRATTMAIHILALA